MYPGTWFIDSVRCNVIATNGGWFDVGAENAGGNAVVGGTVSPDNNVFKFGGTNPGSLSTGVGTDPAALGVDFDATLRALRGRSQCWSALPATGMYDPTDNTFTGDGSASLQVFYVDTDVIGVGPSFINVPVTATVLVNFIGPSRTWDVWGTHWGDTSTPIGSHREQVLFNFYEPITVTFGGGSNGPIEANVLAARGDSTTLVGADVNGRLILGGNLIHNNSEIHNYPFTGTLPACDWGDHPDTPYPTVADAPTQAASHVLTPGLYLGECVDGEPNGQPSSDPDTAIDDDNTGSSANPPETLGTCAVTGDDEDGVQPYGAWQDGPNGGAILVDVVAPPAGACLNGWIDWSDANDTPNTPDGNFNNSADYIIQNMHVNSGSGQIINFDVPAGTFDGASVDRRYHARFRLTQVDANGNCDGAEAYGGTASPDGPANSGEVEDYVFTFTPNPVTLRQQKVASASTPWGWPMLLGGFIIAAAALRRFRLGG